MINSNRPIGKPTRSASSLSVQADHCRPRNGASLAHHWWTWPDPPESSDVGL